jgi:hypothetical protein
MLLVFLTNIFVILKIGINGFVKQRGDSTPHIS